MQNTSAARLREAWRWKPRLVWVLMHTVALSLSYAAGAWPTACAQHYTVLLVVTALLYATVSFGDPGYIAPETSALASLAVPLVSVHTCTHCGVQQPARAKACCCPPCPAQLACQRSTSLACAHGSTATTVADA